MWTLLLYHSAWSVCFGVCVCRPWEENFFAEATGQAYQDLYNNHNGMANDMVNFWVKSASYFHNNSNVIGYELINEPWAGDVYAVSSARQRLADD